MNFEVSENTGVRRLMNKSNFNKDKYVKSIIKSGDTEISKHINYLNQWIENSALEMKKEIYKNCNLFIEAGKTVGQLESTMNIINMELTEQSRLINELQDMKLISDNSELDQQSSKPNENNNEYQDLLDKIDGVNHLMKPDRNVIFADDLQELDPDNLTVLRSIKLILMTDLLLIAKRYMQRNNEMGYRLVSSYDISNVAVANVSERDFSNAAHVFKLMVFPETRVLKAESSRAKAVWMQQIERQLRVRQGGGGGGAGVSLVSLSLNSMQFKEYKDEQMIPPMESELPPSLIEDEEVIPDWLLELPDDLDIAIAERDFTRAVELVEKARKELGNITATKGPSDGVKVELANKVDFRAAQLTEALSEELCTVGSGGGRRGGLHGTVRVAATMLGRLGRRGLACELLLAHRRQLIANRTAQVAREGSQALFAGRLSFTFHRTLLESVVEFRMIVGENSFQSRLYCWCEDEMRRFSEQLRILLVESRAVPFLVLCEVMERVRAHSSAITQKIGVPLETVLDNALLDCWERLAVDHAKVLFDAVELRAIDEQWEPYRLAGQKDRDILLRDMAEAGINISDFVSGMTVALTQSSCQLARGLTLFCKGLSRLGSWGLAPTAHDQIAIVLQAHLNHCIDALSSSAPINGNDQHRNSFCNGHQPERRKFILENLMFVSSVLLPKLSNQLNQLGQMTSTSPFEQVTVSYSNTIRDSTFVAV